AGKAFSKPSRRASSKRIETVGLRGCRTNRISMEAFMKPYKAVAALIAAGVLGPAFAVPMQQDPTWRAESEYKYADAPVAAPLNANSEDDIVKGVVDALNQDASLKGSKITV